MSGAPGYSLRRRLVWLVSVAILAVGLPASLIAYQRTHHEADELLDTQLAQLAETLLAIAAGGEIDHFVAQMGTHPRRYAVPIAFEVRLDRHGSAKPLVVSPGHTGFANPVPPGFSDRTHRQQHWRLFAIADRGAHYTVVVGQRHDARDQLARETGLSLLMPILLALPPMALAVGWGVRRALRPIDALAREVGALDAGARMPLDASVRLPAEIVPLRAALNTLIERVASAFESERRFTADAAHELRTPLAALKIQAQVAQRAQPGEAQRHALAQTVAGVDRMSHLVEQLLTLARTEPGAPYAPVSFDPAPRLARIAEAHAAAATRRRQTLAVELAPGCRIVMEPAWLDIAARNLIDNALNYAGDGARIEVRLTRGTDGCQLRVADDGPGVPADRRAALSARFLRGESDVEGCGLGLSIVERIAARSHARLELGEGLPRAEGGSGFAAVLRFDAVRKAGAGA